MSDSKSKGAGTLKLKEELAEKEKLYYGKDDIFGMTLLTNPGRISSSRNIMFTSHLRQFVNLEHPDYPAVSTNYENTVGKNSTGYYRSKRDYVVVDRIPKFHNGINDSQVYFLFVYDEEKNHYDIIEKRVVEDLTEKFGFSYNNSVLDTKHVDTKIKKGEVLYKTTSYDDDMNYCYGKNVKFAYMLEPHTIEDAIIISRSFSRNMSSKEIETVKVSLNDNDVLLNLYGDEENYKGFPNIGEYVNTKIICAKRRIHNNQILYDLKKSNLRRINFSSDGMAYCEGGKIVDMNIYCNKPLDEIPDNIFNTQLKQYVIMQREFYQRMYDRCKEIIESGATFSNDVNYHFKKAANGLDDNYKWREEDNSVFSNMVIEFVVERSIPLDIGQKITGRYGNKGVIAQIWEDDQMPILDTGEVVDVIFNTLGVINRLNSEQLFEQSITFISNRVRERLNTLESMEDKIQLLTRFIWYCNPDQSKALEAFLRNATPQRQQDIFDQIARDRIYVVKPPMWEDVPLFDRLSDLYDEFTWIKPYDVYVNRFGRRIKTLKPLIVGDMYVIKLKQTSKKGHSARSTGSLSKKGVPEKSNKAKNHQEPFSKTPIRFGDQENINASIGVPSHIVAAIHMFYRSSMLGRRYLGSALMESTEMLENFEGAGPIENRNVEILQAFFKALGIRMEFSDDKMLIKIYTDAIGTHVHNDKMYICTLAEFEEARKEAEIREKYNEEYVFVGTRDEFEAQIQKELEEQRANENKFVIDIVR